MAIAPITPAAAAGTANMASPPLPTPPVPAPLPAVHPLPLPPELVPAPISSTPVPAPTADDPGKFKLKPRAAVPAAGAPDGAPLAVSAASAPVLTPPTASAVAPGSVPIVKPTLPAAALASPAFTKPAGPNSGRPNMPISPLPASGPVAIPTGGLGPRPQGKLVAQTEEKDVARGKFAVKLLVALLLVSVVLFGVLAYSWFGKDPVPAPVVARPAPASTLVDAQPAEQTAETSPTPSVAGTTPSAVPAAPVAETPRSTGPVVVDNPQSLPGQLIAKAQKAAAAHDAALSQPANDVMTSGDSDTAAPSAVAPVEMKPVPAPEPVAVVRPEPGANFKSFVVNLKINGVFQGENARAMLNGKMYRLGEVVDAKLGIVFLRLEPEDKRIVFEDAKGALMSRRY